MRDKLIELIKEARDIGDRHCEEMGSCAKCHELGYDIGKCGEIIIADHLIANGVTFAKDNNVPCKKPMTNGDKIRAMSDEGLAEFNSFCPFIDEECTRKGCIACVLEWLKQPAEVDE